MPTGGLAWPEMDAENDLAAIMMTSGSTADPKGVAVTHRNIEANTRSIISYLHLTANDRMMVVLPFCYCFGLSLLHTHLRVGGSVVLNNTFIFPDKVLDEIEATACSGFAGVPSTYRILLRKSRLKSRPLRSLQHVQQAGGRMPPFVIEELARALCPHTRIFVMYGATEATARLSYLPPSCLTEKNGSIGIPIPGVAISIRDPDGRALPAGETGEIVGQGPNITKGYYNDPQLTAQRFKHGAFHTGDLGFMDTDGFIFVEGREADFVKTYGFRVSPREVEDCIGALDKVLDVTVIGVPDIEAGEALAALVVPVDGSGLTESELRQFCVSKLPNHKVPQMFKLLPKLPRSRSGKLMKSRLSEFLSEHGQRSAATAPAHRGVVVQV
jgi:acyl-CoA synthetase (AMP-forming)/AMP-acid ligase II